MTCTGRTDGTTEQRQAVDIAVRRWRDAQSAEAAEVLATLLLAAITPIVRARWPSIPEYWTHSAVADAIVWYLLHPDKHDPSKAPLVPFLSLVALRKARDFARSSRRWSRRWVPLDSAVDAACIPYDAVAALKFEERLDDARRLARTDQEMACVEGLIAGASATTAAHLLGQPKVLERDAVMEVRKFLKRLRARARYRLQS